MSDRGASTERVGTEVLHDETVQFPDSPDTLWVLSDR